MTHHHQFDFRRLDQLQQQVESAESKLHMAIIGASAFIGANVIRIALARTPSTTAAHYALNAIGMCSALVYGYNLLSVCLMRPPLDESSEIRGPEIRAAYVERLDQLIKNKRSNSCLIQTMQKKQPMPEYPYLAHVIHKYATAQMNIGITTTPT